MTIIRKRYQIKFYLALFIMLSGVSGLVFYYLPIYLNQNIDTVLIEHWGGYAYTVRTPDLFPDNKLLSKILTTRPDSARSPSSSTIQLFENGNSLGTAHSLHANIAEEGYGRYSHWGNSIIFSTSDNTSPIQNGRVYSLSFTVPPRWWLSILVSFILFSGFYFLLLTYRKYKKEFNEIRNSIINFLHRYKILPDEKNKGYYYIIIGILLIILPISLVKFWPYARSPYFPDDPYYVPNSYFLPKAERISSWNDERLERLTDEHDLEYITRMLDVVHNATYHCEEHDYTQSWFTWATWKLGIFSLIPNNINGVLDVKTFRCGYCGQRSFILAKALRGGGISSAEILGLSGHVVTVVDYDDDLYSVDPDYGIGPVKITGLDSADNNIDNKEIKLGLERAYAPLVEAYGKDFIQNNVIDTYLTAEDNKYSNYDILERVRKYQSILFSFEKIFEFAFFAFGVSLILFGIYSKQKFNRKI